MRGPSFLLFLLLSLTLARADVAVLTQHNNPSRTGANLQESTLNVSNVNSNQFGLLFSRTVDDQIYAQPLIMTNVDIPGKGVHNLIIVATVNDSVYAFDADNASVTAPYWHVNYTSPAQGTNPVHNTDMTGACNGDYQDFSGNIGIVGTPVIDPATGTIYFVHRIGFFISIFYQFLDAIDARTGAQRTNSPVIISGSYPGHGGNSAAGLVFFDPLKQNQRPGLALVNGTVYIGWASHCDWDDYHGWIIGYDATTLKQTVVYNTTPEGQEGGIWMSGQAPAVDENNNLYVSVGNGTVGNTNGDPRDVIGRGESFLKLTRSGTNLTVASWFTPWNWATLDAQDLDLGSCGFMLIPGTTLAVSASKEGKMYLMNRDNMGGLSFSNADTNILQIVQVTAVAGPNNNIHGGPVWWNGPTGPSIYLMGESDYVRQFKFDTTNSRFITPNFAQSPTAAPYGMPGGMLALSANGTNAGSGVVWVSHAFTGDANHSVRPGILAAYDAANVSHELWNSEQVSARDTVGNFAKFVPPTVANGKVYLATFSNKLNVYGLLPSIGIAPSGKTAVIAWPTNNSLIYSVQASTNLASTNWVDVTNAAGVTNGLFQIAVPASNRASFYRLKSQ